MATREETKKMVEVMNAYIEGREIEGKQKSQEMYDILIEPNWNWVSCDYRIKEKEVRHKYKAGDYVLVLDGSDIPDYTGSWEMSEYVGKIYQIKSLDECLGLPSYHLHGDEWELDFDERGLALVKIGE